MHHALRHEAGWLVAASHVLCALVGGGVLSLPHAVSWTGAVPGAVCLAVFLAVGVCSALLLVSARTSPRDGVRHATYHGAANAALGPRAAAAVAAFQNTNNVLSATGYTIAAGQSARMVARALGGAVAVGPGFGAGMSALFGLAQVGMSQLPSLEEAWWSSALGALMSLAYAASAVALSAIRLSASAAPSAVAAADEGAAAAAAAALTPLGLAAAAAAASEARARALFFGRAAPSPALKAVGVFNALGALMFAFNFSSVQIEIHDTLHEPPDSDRAMRRATVSALLAAFCVYAAVAFSGQAALGDAAPGDVLTGFSDPRWLVAAANVFVLVHMFGAFQLFSQPVFQAAEAAVVGRWPRLARPDGAAAAGAGAGAGAGGGGGGNGLGPARGGGHRRGRRRGQQQRAADDRGTSSLIRGGGGAGNGRGGGGSSGPPPGGGGPRVLAGGGIYRPGGGYGAAAAGGGYGGGEIELGGAESWHGPAFGAGGPAYGAPAPAAFRLDSEEDEHEEEEQQRGGQGRGRNGSASAAAAARAGGPLGAGIKPPDGPLPDGGFSPASHGPDGGSASCSSDGDGDGGGASAASSSSSALGTSARHERPPRAALPLRLALRTAYVIAVTAAAVAFEDAFEGIVGLGGAVVYWPQAVYVPTAIFVASRSPGKAVRRALGALNVGVGAVAALATVGAVHSLMAGLMDKRREAGDAPAAAGPWGVGGAGGWPASEVVYGPPEGAGVSGAGGGGSGEQGAQAGGGAPGRRRLLLALFQRARF